MNIKICGKEDSSFSNEIASLVHQKITQRIYSENDVKGKMGKMSLYVVKPSSCERGDEIFLTCKAPFCSVAWYESKFLSIITKA